MERDKSPKGKEGITMKNVKIVVIATAITIALILACGIATATAEPETYEVNAVVIEMRIAFPGVWELIAVDEHGEKWGWYEDNGNGEYPSLHLLR